MKKIICTALYLFLMIFMVSCIKDKNLYIEKPNKTDYNYPGYLYPFEKEIKNALAEITIKTKGDVPDNTKAEIPVLKYNKSWLLMLTQDDCMQVAYCCTWSAINGKALTNKYFYDAPHLLYGDLPPDARYLGKTLGSSDGAGNEVRFAFTTTLLPEANWMNALTSVDPGNNKDYLRFFMKTGLIWNNVKDMLNYGVGIAFHDVMVSDANNPDEILKHYNIAQDTILKRLSGRGCKMLAEPNGNKTYVTAALNYAPIQTMTAQAGTVELRPFQVTDDLQKTLLHRIFTDNTDYFKNAIIEELKLPKEDRRAIYIGVHGTGAGWVDFLLWLNNTYGKDGDDSMWFPSQEEYYEYNYYRRNSTLNIAKADANTLKLNVTLPSKEYFYYPSVTINLKGIKKEDIVSVSSNETVKGLSFSDYEDGVMITIDCRKFLVEHATHFVELYEKDKSNKGRKADATYFVNMLKASDTKTELLNRIK